MSELEGAPITRKPLTRTETERMNDDFQFNCRFQPYRISKQASMLRKIDWPMWGIMPNEFVLPFMAILQVFQTSLGEIVGRDIFWAKIKIFCYAKLENSEFIQDCLDLDWREFRLMELTKEIKA